MIIIGIIGPPQSGKSTIFRVLTGQLDTAPIHGKREPVQGVATVPDPRLGAVAQAVNSRKVTPATINFIDIPGVEMVEGRSGPFPPKYLAELKNADLLILVVRLLDEADEAAARAIDDACLEFVVSDHAIINRRLEKLVKMHDPASRHEAALLQRCLAETEDLTPLNGLSLTDDELRLLKGFSFLSLKPLMVVINMDEDDAPQWKSKLVSVRNQTSSGGQGSLWMAVSAAVEADIARLELEEQVPFLNELGFTASLNQRIITAAREQLGLITFLTAGEKEARAWTLPRGATALQAADAIHADIARGFIRAEVCRWDDLVRAGSYSKLKTEAKLRLEGKDYIMQDGDVITVRFNV